MTREKGGLREYIISNIYFLIGTIAVFDLFVVHRVASPLTARRVGEGMSLLILIVMSLLLVTLGALVTHRSHRTWFSVLLTGIIPIEIYSLLCVWPERRTLTVWMLGLLAVCAAALQIMAFAITNGKPKPYLRAARSFVIMLRPVAALLLLPFLVLAVVGPYIPKAGPLGAERFNLLLSESGDMLLKLGRESWPELSQAERVDALQFVIELEAAHLGTPHTPTVEVTELEGLVRGQFHPIQRTIAIDTEWINESGALQCLNTILHEMYHYYQFCMTELLNDVAEEYKGLALLSEAAQSAANFGDYKNGGDDYFTQPVEVNARAYAEQRSVFYVELIGDIE